MVSKAIRAATKRAARKRTGQEHPAMRYARDVVAGKVVAGRLVKLACERHVKDLKTAHQRGLYFDDAAAQRVLEFVGCLRHSKGEWAGQPFLLAPWQLFLLWVLFGWRRADGTRRFRMAYCELARKNGKTTLAAAVGLYLAFADGEGGAEVYAAATKLKQARLVFGEARRMVRKSPALRKRITCFRDNLHIEETASKFEPLPGDGETEDGLNVHGAIIDELHAHPNRELFDVLDTGTGARRQPLIFVITTAGFDRQSVCWEQHDYAVKILEGTVEDDTFFGFVAAIDEGDDWQDPTCWPKANPNLGVSVKADDIARKVRKAKLIPAQQNNIRRKHLNEWTEQDERWLGLDVWKACGRRWPEELVELLRGRPCYGGLDLSSKIDLTAFVLVFPPRLGEPQVYHAMSYFWCPRENMRRREKRDRVPYGAWAAAGQLRATEGNVIDYDVIRRDVNELGKIFRVKEIAFDTWNAQQLATQLTGDGFTMAEFRQGFASMSGPTKDLEALLVSRRLEHGRHPVLTWCASNVAIEIDPAGNYKPSKKKSRERIDGIVALIMGLGRAMVAAPAKKSVYARRGVICA